MGPASKIIALLGGDTAVAAIVGVHRTRVANWKRPKAVGGSGGMIPMRHIPTLLASARDKGIDISADDFMPVAEVAA